MTPVIAVPGFRLPDLGPGARDQAALPELPGLSALLRGARRLPDAADLCSGVIGALGVRDVAGAPSSCVAACATTLGSGTEICFARPVHAVTGINRVFMGDAGSLRLNADEQESLRQAFNEAFGAPGLQLHPTGSGWLLQAPFAAAACDADPALLAGSALDRAPARSAALRLLRRLGAEIEMWLVNQPVNQARHARGEMPVNAFWFWGGAAMVSLQRPTHAPGLIASNRPPDPWLAGLAALCDVPVRQALHWDEEKDAAGVLIALQQSATNLAAQLEEWDRHWFEPVLRDLDAGRLSALRLQIGGSGWQWPAPRIRRWLRPRRTWWQMLPDTMVPA